jgi:hypothetical protein
LLLIDMRLSSSFVFSATVMRCFWSGLGEQLFFSA